MDKAMEVEDSLHQQRVEKLHARMVSERNQHRARVEKELKHHQEVMSKLEQELSALWSARLGEVREGFKRMGGPKAAQRGPDDWVIEPTPNGQLSNGDLTLRKKTEKRGWDCDSRGSDGWSEGVHEWTVFLDTEGFGVGLGIVSNLDEFDPTDDSKNGHLSFVVNLTTGGAYDNLGNKAKVFPPGVLPAGSLVTIRLDMDQRTITFGLNGVMNDAPTFTDIPEDTWYPLFAIAEPDKTVSIIRGEQLEEWKEALRQPQEDAWTISPTPNGTLSEDGLSLVKSNKTKGWDCDAYGLDGWSEGVHEWTVRLDSDGNGVALGIVSGLDSFDPTDDSKNSNMSFIVNCNTGVAYDDEGNKRACFSKIPQGGLPKGTLVHVHLDLDEGTLTYGLNGHWNASATFKNIPSDTWHPLFALGVPDKGVSVVRE